MKVTFKAEICLAVCLISLMLIKTNDPLIFIFKIFFSIFVFGLRQMEEMDHDLALFQIQNEWNYTIKLFREKI